MVVRTLRFTAKLNSSTHSALCPSCSQEQDRDVNAARNILWAGLSVGQPGGDIPACRKEEEQRSARSATTGALRYDTEQYWNAGQGGPPEPVKLSI